MHLFRYRGEEEYFLDSDPELRRGELIGELEPNEATKNFLKVLLDLEQATKSTVITSALEQIISQCIRLAKK
jgi:hypothetical protein